MAIIFALAGLAVIYFSRSIADAVGYVDFAENFFGSGGTRTMVILIGIVVFFLSLVYATGGFAWLLGALGLGRIF